MGVYNRTHSVVLETSLILRKGSSVLGERRMHGANTIARELAVILLFSSSFATLKVSSRSRYYHGTFIVQAAVLHVFMSEERRRDWNRSSYLTR